MYIYGWSASEKTKTTSVFRNHQSPKKLAKTRNISIIMMTSSSRGRSELQGPRPTPLKVSNTSSKIIKKSSSSSVHPKNQSSRKVDPVVIYLRSPKIIHVRPEEFMSLVQRLTGKNSTATTHHHQVSYPSSPSSSSGAHDMVADEPVAPHLKRDNMFGADHTMANLNTNEVDFADPILGLSPTWQRFLACV